MFDTSMLFDGFLYELRGVFQIIGVVLLLYGLVNAFFGYKLFKLVLTIIGFLTGAVIGAVVSLLVGDGSPNGGVTLLCVLIGGIIGAVLAVALHRLGVFLAVGAMGFVLFFLVTKSVPVALLLGIICGIIGAVLEKYAIIVSTALSGGSVAATGIGLIASLGSGVTVVIGLLIGVCGIVFQLWLERRKPAAAAAAVTATAAKPQPVVTVTPPAGAPVVRSGACCPNCGSALSAGASFCRNCGRMIQMDSTGSGVRCARCGSQMSGNANFCNKCGAARGV